MAAMTEQLTILTTGGGAATKIVTRREDGSYHFTPYSAGYLFRWADIQIFDESFWQTGIVTQKANLGELVQPLPNLPTYRQSKGLARPTLRHCVS